MSDSVRAPSARGERLRADLFLLLVALVWGSAFVAQRLGMEQVGPFAFNATRFAVGALTLVPVVGWKRLRAMPRPELRRGAILGLLLFIAASLQQIGLLWTTAGKAGFITGLYVVIVPLLLALGWQECGSWSSWLGAGLATAGLFLLSVRVNQTNFSLAPGDGWVLGSAVVWALHVIAIGWVAPGRNPLRLAMVQFIVCSLLSFVAALVLEPGTWGGLLLAAPAVLYAGILSIGLGYTGQVVAQRHTRPTHAAIILSLESVFAALSGWLVLGETLSPQQLGGCGLMLGGMLLAQIPAGRDDLPKPAP
ncbi:MAG: DMT family transporter [Anaerolineae bacterium]|nr:DMT family transporter [Anaerolineae bacterium]